MLRRYIDYLAGVEAETTKVILMNRKAKKQWRVSL